MREYTEKLLPKSSTLVVTTAMIRLELKIPPALVFLFFAGAMYLLARFLPAGRFDFFGRMQLAWFLGGLAVAVGSWAVLLFLRHRTPADPAHPDRARKLVVGGVYNFSRNPMYLSLLLLLLAWGLYLENVFNTLLCALFVAYMNRFQILPEERALASRFGAAFRQYCLLVRRWF